MMNNVKMTVTRFANEDVIATSGADVYVLANVLDGTANNLSFKKNGSDYSDVSNNTIFCFNKTDRLGAVQAATLEWQEIKMYDKDYEEFASALASDAVVNGRYTFDGTKFIHQ